jgi:hypothetical protein
MHQVIAINGVPVAGKSEIEQALAHDLTLLTLTTDEGIVPLIEAAPGEYTICGPSATSPTFFALLKIKPPKDGQPRRYRVI